MSDELDPILDEDTDDLLVVGKKKGGLDDEDDLFGEEAILDEEDPFLAEIGGFGFGADEDAY